KVEEQLCDAAHTDATDANEMNMIRAFVHSSVNPFSRLSQLYLAFSFQLETRISSFFNAQSEIRNPKSTSVVCLLSSDL
ncbi:MAG: hypothetical protein PVH81_12105, partial [Syntrophobacterales bacterium]